MLAAQERLAQLQAKSRAERLAQGAPVDRIGHGRTPSLTPSPLQPLPSLPAHLGWDSAAVTAVARQADHAPKPQSCIGYRDIGILEDSPNIPIPIFISPYSHSATNAIKLYPDIAAGMFQWELTAAGRIWLLLRHLDCNGRGWLDVAEVRAQLTGKESPWRVCGWRQLRNLLAEGDGVFWVRGDGRVWLRSTTNVAAALQVPHLALLPVALPVSVLTLPIGQVRAHLYAAFHSSRAGKTPAGQPAAPIARDTIANHTNVIPRTQRRYEKAARVHASRNFAIGGKASESALEEAAWQHGQATFRLNDKKGIQGKTNQGYIAWQLPNSYTGPHRLQPKGQQKRINQALSDLFMQGMTGNGQGRMEKRFYGHGRAAAQAYNRGVTQDIYWPAGRGENGRAHIWHCLAAPNTPARK
ncbi:MAG: hypothetical protein BroJett015_35050 [Chloroflexota bacterium]|nr:hypothetical protein [Chloroflexota bacterium]GIK57842.1 MAG: hypothetical protein BroJett015_35050 [Chloroflexota bacterium]